MVNKMGWITINSNYLNLLKKPLKQGFKIVFITKHEKKHQN